jgi:hypothetical protein
VGLRPCRYILHHDMQDVVMTILCTYHDQNAALDLIWLNAINEAAAVAKKARTSRIPLPGQRVLLTHARLAAVRLAERLWCCVAQCDVSQLDYLAQPKSHRRILVTCVEQVTRFQAVASCGSVSDAGHPDDHPAGDVQA